MDMDVDLKLEMNISHKELRVLLLHEFHLGHKVTEARSNRCGTMDKDALYIRTAQHWFNRFKSDNFELDDLPRAGRPLELNMDVLKQFIEDDPRLTTRCLAEQLGCSHTTVETHRCELGKTWKYGVCIPHELSPLPLQHRVDACMELMTSHRNYQWLHNLITGDETWVLYVNHTCKRQWLGVQEKQVKSYSLHDNARPHIAKSTREKLLKLGWSTVSHPAYSPDLAPTDYHLNRSLSNHRSEKKFDDEKHLKMELVDFFGQKPQEFYEREIFFLAER
ncbi:unnamed protein product [Rotaria socialis]|uniref:Mos1 transposase HTH domain-containing protein n=1 Tax=Rotaria socialis TaxID=392032 RepID=A0A821IT55_9BILA|nr:unnamed protein product [Rotaria socialis]CAF4708796.1 unnamed protein product [Rotaria socialis]